VAFALCAPLDSIGLLDSMLLFRREPPNGGDVLWSIMYVCMYKGRYTLATKSTSSYAVAERPRDALCPSVAILNKIITRADCFIIVT